MPSPIEQIKTLDAIEKDIVACILSAGCCLQELSKEKPSQKAAENHSSNFLKALNTIESKLSEQINYLLQVSTSTSHEGSGYASAKTLQMAWHRIHNVKDRLRELEECAKKHEMKQTNLMTIQQAGTTNNNLRPPQQQPAPPPMQPQQPPTQ